MELAYLREVLKGHHRYGLENRLSQIFSASFNHSPVFKRHVGDFLSVAGLQGADCVTEVHCRKKGAILDIVLQSPTEKRLVVIENKIDSTFGKNQLKKYSGLEELTGCKKFCFLKHYYAKSNVQPGWKLAYWGDFYLHLRRQPDQKRDFFCNNFVATLEDYGMDSPMIIKKVDLQTLVQALHVLRSPKPEFSFHKPVFETLLALQKLLEDTFRRAAKEAEIQKRAGGAFHPNMRLSHWFIHEDKPRANWLWIGCEAQIAKLQKKTTGLKSFGAALILYEKTPKYDLIAYVTKLDGTWPDNMMTYRKGDVDCADYSKKAIAYWKKAIK